MTQRRTFTFGLASGLLLGGLAVWIGLARANAQSASPVGPDWSGSSRNPYVLMSGQSTADSRVLYILDQDSGRLVAVKFTSANRKQVQPLAHRDLAKDFERDGLGTFSMTSVQISGSRAILAITDNTSDKLVLYEVDSAMDTIKPIRATRMDKLFSE